MIGSLVVTAIAILVIGTAVIVWLFKRRWPVHASQEWISEADLAVTAAHLIARVQAHKGWRIVHEDERELRVRCRMTARTYAKELRLELSPHAPARTHVAARATSPQLVDWGDGRRALDYLRSS